MSPTITVASFFSFFFVRPQNVCVVDTFSRTTKSTEPASGITSELLQRVPLFVYSIFNVRYKTGLQGPPLNFFGTVRLFFRNFFCRQTVPPSSFLTFCSKLKFQKAQRVPPSLVFGTLRNSHFSFFRKFFQKNFRIFLLSPSIFLTFCNRLDFQKAERVPPFTSLKT